MEIIAIINILNFCWFNFILECSKIAFIKFSLRFSRKSLFSGVIEASLVVTVDSICSDFGIALTK